MSDAGKKKTISVVIPAYNEENNVERTYRQVTEQFDCLAETYNFELLFIDDHSQDRTFDKLRELAQRDHRVKIYRFSRNYGFQRAVHTGYVVASGDAAIQLDCDLQDPPQLIPRFIELWEQGYSVVYGIRRNRKEGYLITAARRFFYWFLNKLSVSDIPRDAGDCRLVDRRVIRELKKIRDTHIYVRGRIAEIGFRQIGIEYDRDAREFDESKFGIINLMGLALDGIVSHSVIPLRLATILGLIMMVVAFIAAIGYVVGRLFFALGMPPGFATLVVLLLFGMGLNGLFLGIIGEYIARMYAQLKILPEPIIETSVVDGEISES